MTTEEGENYLKMITEGCHLNDVLSDENINEIEDDDETHPQL